MAFTESEKEAVKIDPDLAHGEKDIGLVAQEVYSLIPEAVHKPEDEAKELWRLDYAKLVPVLIRSVQEQQQEIELLKKEVSELKKR